MSKTYSIPNQHGGWDMVEADQIIYHLHRTEGPAYQDCLEIGTPGKGGVIKVYGDASKPEEFEAKLRNMMTLRERAQALISQPQQGGNQE